MSESNVQKVTTRIVHKHDIPENWAKATNFIPKQGELIIYDDRYVDKNGNETIVADSVMYKIGDGVTSVVNLPFIGGRLSRTTFISLTADGWSGNISPYSQIINPPGITVNSKVDIHPTAEQLNELLEYGISLQAINEDGLVTVYATGAKPTSNYNIQILITETEAI